MTARQDPQLQLRARRVRYEDGEGRRLPHDAQLGADLLAKDVAVETAPLVLVVLARLAELPSGLVEHDGNRRQARVGMVRRHPGLLVAARHEDVADLTVSLQIEETVAVHPED